MLFATISLFVLKVSGLVFDGGYTLGRAPRRRQQKRAESPTTRESIPDVIRRSSCGPGLEQTAAAESRTVVGAGDVQLSAATSPDRSAPTSRPSPQKRAKTLRTPKTQRRPRHRSTHHKSTPAAVMVALEPVAPRGERAISERLSDRRQQLDEPQSRHRDAREPAEAGRAAHGRQARRAQDDGCVSTALKRSRRKPTAERFKAIVAMYENMKSKDAARIFDRLDMKILVDVSTQMKPARDGRDPRQHDAPGSSRAPDGRGAPRKRRQVSSTRLPKSGAARRAGIAREAEFLGRSRNLGQTPPQASPAGKFRRPDRLHDGPAPALGTRG